ncbi:MAG: DUF929 family protein [Acidimicrobiaceae bacterium]|nr:DUF929 family protein [Acidimicrobiaceae bacterium]
MSTAVQRSIRSSSYAWIATAVVVIIVVTLVVVKVTRGSGGSTGLSDVAASATLQSEVTTSNMRVADATQKLVSSSVVAPLTHITGQPPLTLGGKPDVLYVGAEWCPFCAAQRWALAVALGRFGTLSGLDLTWSSDAVGEAYPRTPTLSFVHVSYSSPYISFESVETETRTHQPLQALSPRQQAVFSKYDQNSYLPANQPGYPGSIPFLDVGNSYFQAGSSFSPGVLSGLTQSSIAAGLSVPSNPVTQAIVGAANEITAGICTLTHAQPTSVCRAGAITAMTKSSI